MSNVIDFLEMMGQDAQMRNASRNEVKLALANAQIAPELQTAILAKDQPQLETLLRQRVTCCLLFSNEDQDDESPLEQCA
ncbi:hypothetical protein [Rhodanobacter sp. C05]|uniref:hypothetical protein n=1 Tax=Rhodanobacter sp. C05 TaxID=1945855 RepID=UPI00098518C5|nr:hypothetical protein [Rhodanobacter sp. C05]